MNSRFSSWIAVKPPEHDAVILIALQKYFAIHPNPKDQSQLF